MLVLLFDLDGFVDFGVGAAAGVGAAVGGGGAGKLPRTKRTTKEGKGSEKYVW